MLSNKGITPLIATVLLIGFTVALAAVIITWGGGFVDTMTKRTSATTDVTLKCATELRFSISKASCDETNIGHIKSVTIENNGDIDIIGVTIRAFPKSGDDAISEKIDLTPNKIGSFDVKTFSKTSDPKLSDKGIVTVLEPTKIDAIVKIANEPGKDPVLCNQNLQEFKLENSPYCQQNITA